MSDTNGNDPKDRDLPGFSSHFSTTLTGLKPMKRRSRATTSTEVPPEETEADVSDEAPATEDTSSTAEDSPEPTAPTAEESLEVVRDESDPPPPSEDADEQAEDPLGGIELRPGLSLVDTAEIPIHRAQAAAKLARIREPEAPPAKPASPPAPQRPVVRNKPPSRRTPPPALSDTSSAQLEPRRSSSGGFGWLYVGVIILIAVLIGALVMQVKDLL